MDFEREDSLIPVGSIIYGGLAALFMMLILTVFLAVFTELGWNAMVTWPNNNLYLVVLYIAVVIGAVMAGWKSGEKGWAVGIGVGVLNSIILIIFALFLHEPVNFGVFLMKTFISCFIGAFGGIIGVNLFGNKA